MQVDKIKVCEPIKKLICYFKEKDFAITEEKVSDYHFHELFIQMVGEYDTNAVNVEIEGIKEIDSHTFCCTCHWSRVKISQLEN